MNALRMPDVRYIWTYAGAAALFDRAKERKNFRYSGTHAMPEHKASFTGLSKAADGTIHFTYHRTDVVQWYPDDTCTLDVSYPSRSTACFANRFAPKGVGVYGECSALCVRGVYYRPNGTIRLDADGRLTHASEDTLPIRQVRVDRKKAKAAAEASGLTAFLAWYKPVAALLGSGQMHRTSLACPDVLPALLDRDQWEVLRCSGGIAGFGAGISAVEKVLRKAVYQHYDAYYTIEHASTPDYGSFSAWTR